MKKLSFCLFSLVLLFCGKVSYCQYVQYSQFNAIPLTVNPALTGMFDGNLRANLNDRNQWAGTIVPFFSYHASVDAPVYTMHKHDYFGAGLSINNSSAGDGNLKNFTGLLSASYHKLFGNDSAWLHHRGCDLAIGLQVGYSQLSIDLSQLYFNNATSISFVAGPAPPYQLGIGNSVSSYVFNSGLTFSQSLGSRFNYTVGFSVNNINQPNDALLKKMIAIVGLDVRYTAIAGCNVGVGQHFSLRPAFIYITDPFNTYYMLGNEFMYAVAAKRRAELFCGLWYRTNRMATVNVGTKFGRLRISMAYDYSVSTLTTTSAGAGGLEFALTYINPSRSKPRHIACNLF